MEQGMSAFERYERGLVLKQVKIFDSALEDFRQAAIHPQYAVKALVQIALCLRSTGRYEEAVAAFRQGLKSPTCSSQERVHILYLLGQTLESLGRYAETLEAYGWIRQEEPGFRDVAHRIKQLSSRGVLQRQPVYQFWVGEILRLGRQLRPHIVSLLGRTLEMLGRYAESLETYRWVKRKAPSFRDVACQIAHRELTPKRRSQPASRDRKKDKRQHARVAVQLHSQFSSKGWKDRMVTGEGELRDLSPWGCRVTSPVAVPVGADLECCIFPQDAVNPFTIEGATVCWISPLEFGLAFTKVRPGVQRQIEQLCKERTPLG